MPRAASVNSAREACDVLDEVRLCFHVGDVSRLEHGQRGIGIRSASSASASTPNMLAVPVMTSAGQLISHRSARGCRSRIGTLAAYVSRAPEHRRAMTDDVVAEQRARYLQRAHRGAHSMNVPEVTDLEPGRSFSWTAKNVGLTSRLTRRYVETEAQGLNAGARRRRGTSVSVQSPG